MIRLKSGHYLGKTEKLLNKNGVVGSITSYPDTSYSEKMHCHETLHVSLVLKGGNVEKRSKTDIERLPGVVTFYNVGEPHQSRKTLPHSTHFNIEIDDAFLRHYETGLKNIDPCSLKTPDVVFAMLQVFKELELNDGCSEIAVHSLVLGLLQAGIQRNKFECCASWFRTICEVMQDRWNENISLSELSKAANVHPVTISRVFPQYFGCTIGEYMRKLKIEKSLHLITNTSDSLTQIAVECGFADQSHFIRTFKKQTGFIPGRYQKIFKR